MLGKKILRKERQEKRRKNEQDSEEKKPKTVEKTHILEKKESIRN